MSYSIEEVEVGDWICWYQGGELIISKVEYKVKDRYTYKWSLCTQVGSVDPEYVLEVRKK